MPSFSRAPHQLRVGLPTGRAPDPRQLLGLDDLGRLVLEGSAQGTGEVEDLGRGAVAGLEHAPDRLQVEPVRLHFARQLDPRHVLVVVVAGAPVDHRRRQQPARLVGADVANGHPRPLRQLADRHLALAGLGRFLAHPLIVSASRCPFIFPAASGAEEPDRLGDVLGRREGGEVLIRALLSHPRGEDRVDDDHVGGRGGAFEAVGKGQGPGLGGGLRGRVGRVRVGGRLSLLGGDEDEAAVLAGEQRVVEGTRRVLHGADQQVVQQVPVGERRLVQRLPAAPAPDQVRQRVDPAEALEERRAPLPGRPLVEQVDRPPVPAVLRQVEPRADLLDPLPRDVGTGDRRPRRGKPLRHGRPETAGDPGDRNHTAVEFVHPLETTAQGEARYVRARPGRHRDCSQKADRRLVAQHRCKLAGAASPAASG